MGPRLWADVVLMLHVLYVSFVVLGLALTILGGICGWTWVRNVWFRFAHLAPILIVVFEAWWGIACPLTTLENSLRKQAGEAEYQGDWIASWLHDLLFFDLPPWAFTLGYSLFGLTVVLTFCLLPPRRQRLENRPVRPM